MVTADEVPPGGKGLKIQTRLNGQVMQSDNTDNMMFPVAETIVYVTQGMTLEPGDIIVTGTPSGVGFARKPPVWMKHGDTCEIDIEGIGILATRSRTRSSICASTLSKMAGHDLPLCAGTRYKEARADPVGDAGIGRIKHRYGRFWHSVGVPRPVGE